MKHYRHFLVISSYFMQQNNPSLEQVSLFTGTRGRMRDGKESLA